MKAICYGIDLGTSNSCISQCTSGSTVKVEVMRHFGTMDKIIPSYVKITSRECIVGKHAKSFQEYLPNNVFYGTKRIIGRPFNLIQSDLNLFTFPVISRNNFPVIPLHVNDKDFEVTPEHIAALVMKDLYESSLKYDPTSTRDAVVTVPASFNNVQRRATMCAGKMAGLNVKKIISEPTAAALYYSYKMKLKNPDLKVLVYDFGGGTLDVSLVHLKGNEFNIIGTTGNMNIGGMDIDRKITEFIGEKFANIGIDINKEENARDKSLIMKEAEEQKILLSKILETRFDCTVQGKTIEIDLTRAMLEHICSKVFKGITKPIDDLLISSDLEITDIDDVIMTGGTSCIPYVRETIKKKIGKEITETEDPEGCVSIGAALYGAILCNTAIEEFPDGIVINEVLPTDISLEVGDNELELLIKRNTRLPAKSFWTTCVTSEDNQEEIELNIFEGNKRYASNCNKIGSYTFNVPKDVAGAQSIHFLVQVTEDKISIYSTTSNPLKLDTLPVPTKVEVFRDLHTAEEINEMCNDIKDIVYIKRDPTPAERMHTQLSQIKSAIRKATTRKERLRIVERITMNIKWINKHQDATVFEINKRLKSLLTFIKEESEEAHEKIVEETLDQVIPENLSVGLILIS